MRSHQQVRRKLPQLPLDIVRHIVEHSESCYLDNFALVSRTWLLATAPILYSSISLYKIDVEDLSLWIDFLEGGPIMSQYVTVFCFRRLEGYIEQILKICSYLPNLRRLELYQLFLQPDPDQTLTDIYDQHPLPLPHLESLIIFSYHAYLTESPLMVYFKLINSFPRIDKLELVQHKMHQSSNYDPVSSTIASVNKTKVGEWLLLSTTSRKDKAEDDFVNAALEHIDMASIHTMHIAPSHWVDHGASRKFMSSLEGVTHFHVHQHVRLDDKTTTRGGHRITLPPSHLSLESITFHIGHEIEKSLHEVDEEFTSEFPEIFSCSIEALSSLPRLGDSGGRVATTHPLSVVRYDFGRRLIPNPEDFEHAKRIVGSVKWSEIDSSLDEKIFVGLQLVEIVLAPITPRTISTGYWELRDGKEHFIKRYKDRAMELADIVDSQLANLARRCTVKVWVRDWVKGRGHQFLAT